MFVFSIIIFFYSEWEEESFVIIVIHILISFVNFLKLFVRAETIVNRLP